MRHNLAASDVFAKIIEIMNHTVPIFDLFWPDVLGHGWFVIGCEVGSLSVETAWCNSRVSLTVLSHKQDWPNSQALGAVPTQALTLLGAARFVAWHLKYPFSGECQQGPRHFRACQACLGYRPAPRPPKSQPFAILTRLVGWATNIRITLDSDMPNSPDTL